MSRTAKIGVSVLLLVVVGGVAAVSVVYGVTASRMEATFDVPRETVPLADDSATLAWGRHLAVTRGCVDCHGEDFGGLRFVDEPPVASLAGSNLTSGEGGIADGYTDADWVRAIRHGVAPDGTPLLFMPSYEYNPMSDEDLGALISYLKSLPPVDRTHEPNRVGPVARALYLRGAFPLIPAEKIDHSRREYDAPDFAPTPEYGAYIAHGCTGCHGADLAGGPVPGGPPEWPPATDISGGPGSVLETYDEAAFFRAMREGVRPDGSAIDPAMPWRNTRHFSDVELRALWLHLSGEEPEG